MTTSQPIDDEIITAFREAPTAVRSVAEIEAAARRFASGTRERAVRRRARKRLASGAGGIAAIVAVAVLFGLGWWLAQRRGVANAAGAITATVEGAAGAVYERVEVGAVQAARLREGRLTAAIDGDERRSDGSVFLVVTADAEVRMRFGRMEVSARKDRLHAVRVVDGSATVSVLGAAPRPLARGESFTAATPVPDDLGQQELEARLDAALELLTAGDPAKAAAALEREATRASSPLFEQAAFWQAVALARAGDPRDATEKLTSFLARFPFSTHRFEAQEILGWQLLQAGRPADARAAFDAALGGDDPRVNQSARQGLDRVIPR